MVLSVKNPPAMLETWVQSLGWEDPLEEGMVTHFSILVWRTPMDRGSWGAMAYTAGVCAVSGSSGLSMGFSRQEHWSGLPWPPPGDLPHPGIEPASPVSPASAGGFSTADPPGQPVPVLHLHKNELPVG